LTEQPLYPVLNQASLLNHFNHKLVPKVIFAEP